MSSTPTGKPLHEIVPGWKFFSDGGSVVVTNDVHTYKLTGTYWSGFDAQRLHADGTKDGRMTTISYYALGYRVVE